MAEAIEKEQRTRAAVADIMGSDAAVWEEFNSTDIHNLATHEYVTAHTLRAASVDDLKKAGLSYAQADMLVKEAGAGVSSWSVNTQRERIAILEFLFKRHAVSAMQRPSLADEDAVFTPPPQQGMAPPDVISCVGKKWGYIFRPEVVRGFAETLLWAYSTHITPATLDMKQRGTFSSVYVTGTGGGKSTALRKSVFEAMQLLQQEPASFGTLQRHIPAVLAALQLAHTAKLAFLYNFGAKACSRPLFAEYWGLTSHSRLAWCLLYAMLRSSELEGAPVSVESLLSSVPGLLEGRALPSKEFIRLLGLNDVLAFIRRVCNIPADAPVCIIFAWDGTQALPVQELRALTEALFAGISRLPAHTWLFLSMASTVSMYNAQAESVLRVSSRLNRHNTKLIPMRPPSVDSMLTLVVGAWQAAVPQRGGGYHLHPSIRLWVSLVEGNLRLLECLLSAASGSGVWYEVRAQPLNQFLSQGASDASHARAILARLITHIRGITKLDEAVASFTKGVQDGQWLLALLGHCLLGDVVQAGDSIAGTPLTYALAQSAGVLSIKRPHEPAGAATTCGLQDADRQHGMVHMPAIIAHILYEAACARNLFSREQPLLRDWSAVLPDLLVSSRSTEYHDLGAIALKVELLRLQGLDRCMLSELVPMQGRALEVFGHTMVWLPVELALRSARHKSLGEEARIPGHALVMGQGTASEADSYIKFELAYGYGDFIIFIQSNDHQQHHTGAMVKRSVAAATQKPLLPDVPAHRQLFVYFTDAAEVHEEELDDNVVIVDAQQHPSFYGTAGVAYRQLASTIIQHTERTHIDAAADLALRRDATSAQVQLYIARLAQLRTDRLAEYANLHNVSLASPCTAAKLTKRMMAGIIYYQLSKRRRLGLH